MTSTTAGVNRRYAHALLDLALERDQAAHVRAALRSAQQVIEGHGELRALLNHPALAGEKKKAIVGALFESGDTPEGLVARLLLLLAERHRMAALAAVERAYTAAWNVRRDVVAAEVVSATGLDAAQLAELRQAIKQKTSRDVELSATVDPGVIGGILLRTGGRSYDGTVKARLLALRQRLVAGNAA